MGTIDPAVQKMLDAHRTQREALIKADEQLHFSSDVVLNAKEKLCNEKLQKLKDQLVKPDGTEDVIARNFFKNRGKVQDSKLFQVLREMPKGAIHPIHTTASPPTETYIQMTYEDITYYNTRENVFRVFPDPSQVKDGFIRCVDYR